jgi:hypothetical protein
VVLGKIYNTAGNTCAIVRGNVDIHSISFWIGGRMKEAEYQALLTLRLRNLIPDCLVLKTDPRDIQGIPDLIILYFDKWAMLEVKMSPTSKKQPNQMYYIETLGAMSYASFINPENEEEVLRELQQAFGITR